ncbi:MAG TPA: hypothetical protein VII51_06400 [Gaiellaceae bacterium]
MRTSALLRRTRPATGRQRALAGLALALLALAAELAGRSLTHRLDVGRHVGRVSYDHARYYPFLLAGVKIAIALMAALVVWRFAKAHAAARAARRVAVALGAQPRRCTPHVRLELSPRLWLLSFVGTSSIYLLQADAERVSADGRLSVFGPWLHSSALPVFAVLSVVVAVLYKGVESWLADAESLAADAVAFARRLSAPALPRVRQPRPSGSRTPRSLFGLEFESRPPPLPA